MARKRPQIAAIPTTLPELSSLMQQLREFSRYVYDELDTKATKKQVWEHTFVFESVSNGTYRLELGSMYPRKIQFVETQCASGTATATFAIAGVNLTGGANAISSTRARTSHLDNNVIPASTPFTMVISSASSPTRVTVCLRGTYDLD